MFRNRAFVGSQISDWNSVTKIIRQKRQGIVTSGLVAHYDPSNILSYPGSGNIVYDISGNSAPNMNLSNVSFLSRYSGSLNFSSSNSTASIASSNIFNFGKTNISIQFWFYGNTSMDTTNTYYSVCYGGNNVFHQGVWRSGLYPGLTYNTFADQASFGTIGGTDPASYVGKEHKVTERWNNFTYTKDGSLAYFYVNGILSAQRTLISNPTNSAQTFTIGNSLNSSFIGYFSNLIMYDKTLSSEEVLLNYDNTKDKFI